MEKLDHKEVEGILIEAKNRLSLPLKALDIQNGDRVSFSPYERTCIHDAIYSVVRELDMLCYGEEGIEWLIG